MFVKENFLPDGEGYAKSLLRKENIFTLDQSQRPPLGCFPQGGDDVETDRLGTTSQDSAVNRPQ